MDSLLRTLIRSKRFQDLTGVLRGLDRVKLGIYETRYTYKNNLRVNRGERNIDDLEFETLDAEDSA